jgi:ATP adenylyltransferase/5',5'''-P-1,P-4-tetraphosphate phosphorylase II
MLEQKIISVEELSKYGPVISLNEKAVALVKQQQKTWEPARKNYGALSEVQTKNFDFGHFTIIAQHNPVRIRSSAAKTDADSIAARPCFLCLENLPSEQKAIVFQNKYLILTNPFPIFPLHLTLSSLEHTPQRILDFFPDMLELGRELTGFTLFYNGPECGASAPDHFHFQAGNRGLLPVENELKTLENQYAKVLVQNQKVKVFAVENYLRRFVAIVTSDKDAAAEMFRQIYLFLAGENPKEPMLNILCYYENGAWKIILFPRAKQRPSHFYRNDETQLVVGPAAVELGGVLVLPRSGDFVKITNKIIAEIYSEVTISENDFNLMVEIF